MGEQIAVSSTRAEDGGLLVVLQVMHLVIRWWIMCFHLLLAEKQLDQSLGLSISDFQVALLLFAARLGKMIRLLVFCKPTVSRDPLDSDLSAL